MIDWLTLAILTTEAKFNLEIMIMFSSASMAFTGILLVVALFDIIPKARSFVMNIAAKNHCNPSAAMQPVFRRQCCCNGRGLIGSLSMMDNDGIYGYDDDYEYDDDDEEDLDDDDDDDDDDEIPSSSLFNDDWLEAEFTLVNNDVPSIPSPELDAMTVANLICRSLQWVDYPTSLAGLERCYEFFTPSFREFVTARQGGKSMERFVQFGVLAPALQPFMGASRVNVKLDEVTKIDAKPPLRGALCTIPIEIHGAPVLTLQHPSGMHRTGIATSPPLTKMVLRLEQQRRPPYQGCWMVREILDVRHAFAGDMGNAHIGA